MNIENEYNLACIKLTASLAVKGAKNLTLDQKIMIHHGIAELFPKDSAEHKEAKETAYALATAEKKQLKLTQLLNT